MNYCWTCRWTGPDKFLMHGLCGSCGSGDIHDDPPAPEKPTGALKQVVAKVTPAGVAQEMGATAEGPGSWRFKSNADAQAFAKRFDGWHFFSTAGV